MRAALGLVAAFLAVPVMAETGWQVVGQSPDEVVAIETASLERLPEGVRFRERRSLRGGQVDPHSRRLLREVLAKRQIDCRGRRIATLTRAVFADNDALIEHRATRPRDAVWQPLAADDPLLRRLCGRSD